MNETAEEYRKRTWKYRRARLLAKHRAKTELIKSGYSVKYLRPLNDNEKIYPKSTAFSETEREFENMRLFIYVDRHFNVKRVIITKTGHQYLVISENRKSNS